MARKIHSNITLNRMGMHLLMIERTFLPFLLEADWTVRKEVGYIVFFTHY